MPYFNNSPENLLAQAFAGGAAMARERRAIEAFELQKDERAFERAQAEKKIEFDRRVRAAAAKVFSAQTPEARAQAKLDLAVESPEAAQKVEAFDLEKVQTESQMASAGLAQQAARQQQLMAGQLNSAKLMQSAVQDYVRDPSTGNALRQFQRLQQGVQAGLVAPEQAVRFREAVQSANVPEIERIGVEAAQSVQDWSPPVKPEKVAPTNWSDLIKKAAGFVAAEAKVPQFAEPQVAFEQAPERMQFYMDKLAFSEPAARAAAGATKINVPVTLPGAQDLAVSEKGRLQAENDMVKSARADVLSIRQSIRDFKGDPFTMAQRFKAWAGDKAEQSGMLDMFAKAVGVDADEVRSSVAAQQAIKSKATMMSYKLLVALSGKATTDREREILFDAMGDPGKMGKTRYVAALNGLDEMFRNRARQTTRVLREGVDLFLDDEDRSAIDAKIADIERRRQAKVIDDAQAAEEMRDVGQTFRSLVAESRQRQAGATDVQTDEPGSATMKVPKGDVAADLARRAKAEGWSEERQREEGRKAGLW